MPGFRLILTTFVMATGYLIYNDPSWLYEVFFHPHYPSQKLDVPIL